MGSNPSNTWRGRRWWCFIITSFNLALLRTSDPQKAEKQSPSLVPKWLSERVNRAERFGADGAEMRIDRHCQRYRTPDRQQGHSGCWRSIHRSAGCSAARTYSYRDVTTGSKRSQAATWAWIPFSPCACTCICALHVTSQIRLG
jgi:hypothetical protein